MNEDTTMSRRQRQARNALLDELGAALRHGPTRKVFRALLDMCGVYDPQTPADRRAVGLEFIHMMGQVGEHEYVNLMKEAADELVELKLRAKRQESRDDD
jgi:hypothetical protein